MTRWEYKCRTVAPAGFIANGKFDPREIEDDLNALGQKGWELVSVAPANKNPGVTRAIHLFLKRPAPA